MTLCNCVLYLGIVFICTSAHACSLLVSVFLVHVLGLNGKSLSRVTLTLLQGTTGFDHTSSWS